MKKKSVAFIGTAILATNPISQSLVVAVEKDQTTGMTNQHTEQKSNATPQMQDPLFEDPAITNENDMIEESKPQSDATLVGNGELDSEEEPKIVLQASNGISVDLNVANIFQTYLDPITNIGPEELSVAVPVSISQANLEGVTIEIPYGFTPDSTNPIFENFSMTAPIFSLVDPGTPNENSIVDHYENDLNGEKLIIHLKPTSASVETLNLRFKFNSDYRSKIPAGQVIWQNLKATVKDANLNVLDETEEQDITADAIDGMKVVSQRFTPTTENYVSGTIINRIVYFNDFNRYSLLDASKENKMFFEVPTGSIISGLPAGYFEEEGLTSEDDPSIPEGHTRYYRELTDDSNSFTLWQYGGDVNSNLAQYDLNVTPPESMEIGDEFHVGMGMIYTKINGAEKLAYHESTYTKINQPEWEFDPGGTAHATGTYLISTVDISKENSSASSIMYAFGYSTYGHTWTAKNNGKRDITGMDFVLYQKSTDSKKLNFDSITVYGTRASGNVALTKYKVKFVIKNSATGETREVSLSDLKGTFNVALPPLNQNEYIDKVHITPMGTDGLSEGHFSSLNGFGIVYKGKNWPNQEWPDGTKIPDDETSIVDMGGTVYYNDESDGTSTAKTIEQNIGSTYYAPGQTTHASAYMVSGNARDKEPGEYVDYTIQGYNGQNAVGDWINPVVSVAVPKVLELQNPSENKDFVDEKNGTTYPDSVKVSLISSDDQYNYYRFATENTGYKNETAVSFSIPVRFKVTEGTPVGEYAIPFTTVANNDPSFVQLTAHTNNIGKDTAIKFGYDNTVKNSYTGYTSGSTPLTVAYATKFNGETSARRYQSEEWSDTSTFAVSKGDTPQMKATVRNTGNTKFSNVRLYNILPSTDDGRGSTDNLSFAGLENISDATNVYYSTKPISELPGYDTNLQNWNANYLTANGFTTTQPDDLTDVTAIYIDYGATAVAPNESLDAVINLLIPDSEKLKGVNKFQYSAKEEGSNTSLNAESEPITFTTEIAQINYSPNLPAILPEGVEAANNIPTTKSEFLNSSGSATITISNEEPELAGYEFLGWTDQGTDTKIYQPGEEVNFTSSSPKTILDLEAVWQGVEVNVIFNENYGDTPKETPKSYRFGSEVAFSSDLKPERNGYEFVGWSSSKEATEPDFNEGSFIDFLNDKTVYAVWKIANYTVSFDANEGQGTMNNLPMTYGEEKALPKNEFTRENYIFQGWSTKQSGEVEFEDQKTVINLTGTPNETVTLYAIWKLDESEVVTKDLTLYVGDSWSPKDNFVSAKDQNGNEIAFDEITLPSADAVNTSTIGEYVVTYSYRGKNYTANVNVLENQEKLEVTDVTIYAGDDWTVSDNFVLATAKNGDSVDFNQVTTENENLVDTSAEGTYNVIYKYGKQEMIGKVIVLKNQTSIVAKDSTIYQGSSWQPIDNFVSATDKTGQFVDFTQVTGPNTNAVNPAKIGEYKITYSFGDKETTVTVKVVENQETLVVRDVTIYEGDPWRAINNFVSATDKDGNSVGFSNMAVTGITSVNPNKEGIYEITFRYGEQVAVAKINVLKNQSSIVAKDSVIYVDSQWKPEDNFVSATDKTGAPVDFDQVIAPAIDAVNTKVPGQYEITYSYNGKTATVTVYVVEGRETLVVKDVIIFEGEDWTASDNFVSATLKDGTPVPFTDVQVSGVNGVNTKRAGVYLLTFSHNGISAEAKVIVLKNQAHIKVKDTVIYVGDDWEEKDNFVSASDQYGNAIDLEKLNISGKVDTNKVGTYEVTYSYNGKANDNRAEGEDLINLLSATAEVQVLDRKNNSLSNTSGPSNVSHGGTTANSLPNTGEKNSMLTTVSGASVFGLASIIAWFRRKRKQK